MARLIIKKYKNNSFKHLSPEHNKDMHFSL